MLLSTLIMENLNFIENLMTIRYTLIDIQTTHPSIIKQLPTSINKCISALLADEQTFHESAPFYQNALRHSNFDHKLDYMKQASQKTHRNRQRNIIWFNPPFSKNVKTNIARNFLCLIDKHFPPNHKLHKIFNRNTVKVSYSCMNNVKEHK